MGDATRAFLLANLALLLAFGSHLANWREQPLLAAPKPRITGGPEVASTPAAPLPTVTLKDMVTFLTKGGAVFVDARSQAAYSGGHIATAINVPANQPVPKFYEKTVMGAQRVIVYCGGPKCGDAATVAQALLANGVPNVAVFSGGFSEWEQAGMPVMKPTK